MIAITNLFGKDFVKVLKQDSWSADRTIAKIAIPIIEQLYDTTHGYPMIEWEDCPNDFVITSDSEVTAEGIYDVYVWNEVLDNILYGLNWAVMCDEVLVEIPRYKYLECSKRARKGLKLFGKYFLNLWD